MPAIVEVSCQRCSYGTRARPKSFRFSGPQSTTRNETSIQRSRPLFINNSKGGYFIDRRRANSTCQSLQLRIYTELQRLAGAVSSAAIDEVAAFTVVNKQRTAALNRSFITRSGLRARKPEGLRTGPCPVAAPLAGNLDNSRHRPAVRLAGASEVV